MNINCEALGNIARHAGGIIMGYYNSGEFNLQHKADGSPVTTADRTAEKYIIEKLSALYPDIRAVGEESYTETASDVFAGGKPFWLIDPLDGTKEFLERTGDFTVNIALVEEGTPICGLVYAPAKDILYTGSADGAYKYAAGKKTSIHAASFKKARPLKAAMSRSHTSAQEAVFLERLRRSVPVELVRAGSSLKFCMVAEGNADFYFRAGRTMYWDSAAGHAVAKAAGAEVIKWPEGGELVYNNAAAENSAFLLAEKSLAEYILSMD